jgi:hypothetical protein
MEAVKSTDGSGDSAGSQTAKAEPANIRLTVVAYYGLGCSLSNCLPVTAFPERVSTLNVIGHAVEALSGLGLPVNVYGLYIHRDLGPANVVRTWTECIDANESTVCLWWANGICAEAFAGCKAARPGVRHITFDFDPRNGVFAKTKMTPEFCARYARALVTDRAPPGYTCPTSMAYPPVNTTVMRPLSDATKMFAVSFACTNFYAGIPHQQFSRRGILAGLSAVLGKELGFWAPAELADRESCIAASYRGFLEYCDFPWMVAKSHVCLCLHVDVTAECYVNERLALLLACGANIALDCVQGLVPLLRGAAVFLSGTTDSDAVDAILAMVSEAKTHPDTVAARCAKARQFAVTHLDVRTWAAQVKRACIEVLE